MLSCFGDNAISTLPGIEPVVGLDITYTSVQGVAVGFKTHMGNGRLGS